MDLSVSSVAEDEYQYLFKIILIGDQAVGKTCIVNRYIFTTYMYRQYHTYNVGI